VLFRSLSLKDKVLIVPSDGGIFFLVDKVGAGDLGAGATGQWLNSLDEKINIAASDYIQVSDSSDNFKSKKITKANLFAGIENYIHPMNHPASMISESAVKCFVTSAQKTAWTNKVDSDDARLSDPREPLAHNHSISTVDNLQEVLDDKAHVNGSLGNDFNSKNITIASSINGYSVANIGTGRQAVSYSGLINGSNKDFVTDNAYNDLQVYINGILYTPDYYSYVGSNLTFSDNLVAGSDLKLFASKGIFGLNNPLLVNKNISDKVLLQVINASSSMVYSLPSNIVGCSVDAVNYSELDELVIAFLGQIRSNVNSDSVLGQKVLNVLDPSLFVEGQDVLITNNSTSTSRAEVNTVVSVGASSLTLQNNLAYSHLLSQYDNVYGCTVIKVPAVSANATNIINLANLASFSKVQTIASSSFQLKIYGA
jgi:hypothetical protein